MTRATRRSRGPSPGSCTRPASTSPSWARKRPAPATRPAAPATSTCSSSLAQANIETLNGYKFKLILTQCPHCFNTLLNEYPQFGGNYQVMHHTQYIEALLAEGQIKVKAEAEAKRQDYVP